MQRIKGVITTVGTGSWYDDFLQLNLLEIGGAALANYTFSESMYSRVKSAYRTGEEVELMFAAGFMVAMRCADGQCYKANLRPWGGLTPLLYPVVYLLVLLFGIMLAPLGVGLVLLIEWRCMARKMRAYYASECIRAIRV